MLPLDAGTALLDATDDTPTCSLTSENKGNTSCIPSCHHVLPCRDTRNPAHGWSSRHSRDQCTCLRAKNDFTGRPDRVSFHVRKASKAAPEKSDRIAASQRASYACCGSRSMNARGSRTHVAVHPCRVKYSEICSVCAGMQNAQRSCTFLTSAEDSHSTTPALSLSPRLLQP